MAVKGIGCEVKRPSVSKPSCEPSEHVPGEFVSCSERGS